MKLVIFNIKNFLSNKTDFSGRIISLKKCSSFSLSLKYINFFISIFSVLNKERQKSFNTPPMIYNKLLTKLSFLFDKAHNEKENNDKTL